MFKSTEVGEILVVLTLTGVLGVAADQITQILQCTVNSPINARSLTDAGGIEGLYK